jgi:transcriptional regulator with XRE-family HTH domain
MWTTLLLVGYPSQISPIVNDQNQISQEATRIGATIRALREGRGLTLKRLGELCGTVPANLSKIENGLVRGYSTDLLFRLAAALGVNVFEIFALASGIKIVSDDKVTPDEWELLGAYRAMPFTQREMLKKVAGTLKR